MRASAPVTRVEGGHLVVTTAVSLADGTELAPLVVRVPIAHADLLDPTATPGIGLLAALAAVRDEDLQVEGPVDAQAFDGAERVLSALDDQRRLAPRALGVDVDERYESPSDGDAIGFLFTGSIGGWSALLDLLDGPPGDRVTHLVSVRHDPSARGVAVDQVAAALGLEAVELESSAQALLGEHRRRADAAWVADLGAALQVAGRMRRLVLPADQAAGPAADPASIAAVRTGRTEVVVGGLGSTRLQCAARVLASPLARRSLRVCELDGAANCGRCPGCLVAMAELAVAGDPDPAAGFDAPLDVDHVRRTALGPGLAPVVGPIIDGLPPAHEELRRAWSDAWDAANGVDPRPRWGEGAPPALAGPTLPQRVAAALRATTGQAVAPAAAPLGWRSGAVALRPALDRHDEIRALVDANRDRPHAWAVVEHHIRDEARDGHQADLALVLADHHGPGPTYLPGILWAWLEPPVLDATAVQALLRTARARLWWRADGDLEPLRVVEAIEQGCLPLQVMPAAAAQELARDLPSALVPLVVAEDDVPGLDLTADGIARTLGPVADHLLAGSAEFDLLTGAYS